MRRLCTHLRLRLAEIEADGYRVAGNLPGLYRALGRVALLRAELQPLAVTPEPTE